MDDPGNSVQSTFFDYDKDGDLDLYVANYPPTPFSSPTFVYTYRMNNVTDIESDHLYRNDGDRFTDVTNESGLRAFGLSLSATVGDLNNDSWPDLYVSSDFNSPDLMYLNNQDGTFREVVKGSHLPHGRFMVWAWILPILMMMAIWIFFKWIWMPKPIGEKKPIWPV